MREDIMAFLITMLKLATELLFVKLIVEYVIDKKIKEYNKQNKN